MATVKENFERIELSGSGIIRKILPYPLGMGDVGSDRFGVEVFQEGTPYSLSGASCQGYFIRSDGATVVINGAVSGNRGYVDLPQSCYVDEGHFSLAVKLVGDGVTGTMRIVDGIVAKTTTDTIVDPGSVVPSIQELLAQIDACEQATADAQAVVNIFDERFDDEYASHITGDATISSATITKIDWKTATIYGSNTQGGVRTFGLFNGDTGLYTTSADVEKRFEPGVYTFHLKVNNVASDKTDNLHFWYTKGKFATGVAVSISDGETYYIDSPWDLGLLVKKDYDFGTSANPTTIEAYVTYAEPRNMSVLFPTNDTTDRSADILASLNMNGSVKLSAGDYYVSGFAMPDHTRIEGCGDATRLILTGENSTRIVDMGSYCTIRDVSFYGSLTQRTPTETIGTKHGIKYEGRDIRLHGVISGCRFYNFNGAGIYANNTGYGTSSGISISDCEFRYCDVGLYLKYLTEYHRVIGCSFTGCYYGCINNGGNNNFAGCGFNSNIVGFYIDNSTDQSANNAHGSCVGCNFNHSSSNTGEAIKIIGSSAGFAFSGLNIFYGKIVLEQSTRVIIDALNAGSDFEIDITGGGLTIFNACSFRTGDDFVANITNNNRVKFVNCYDTNGNLVDPTA